jgi:hypothetical protein
MEFEKCRRAIFKRLKSLENSVKRKRNCYLESEVDGRNSNRYDSIHHSYKRKNYTNGTILSFRIF